MAFKILYFVSAIIAIKIATVELADNATQQPSPATTEPPLQFSCIASTSGTQGKADIILSKGTLSSDIANVTVVSNSSSCTAQNNGNSHKLLNCDLGQKVEIEVTHRPANTHMQRKTYISHFTLTCNSGKPYNVLVETNKFNVETSLPPSAIDLLSHEIPPKHLDEKSFIMSIDTNGSVELGQDLTVKILYNGTDKVPFKVQDCQAFNGDETEHEPLWNENKNCNGHEVFGGKWSSFDKGYSHHVEAFRFDGGNEVKIKCTLLICPHDPNGCEQVCTNTNRKRRSASSSETRTVSASFSVVEGAANASKGVRQVSLYGWIFLVMSSTAVLNFV